MESTALRWLCSAVHTVCIKATSLLLCDGSWLLPAGGLWLSILCPHAVSSMAALMKTGKMYVAESEEAEFMKRCREFALQCVSALARLNVHQALQVSLPCPACFRTQYSADRQSDSVE